MELTIHQHVYDKVMHWVNKADNEVSGFGKVLRTDRGFEVVDAYLIDQEVGGTHTDIDGGALARLMYHTKDEMGELRWWWHSHVKMPVFWSATDKDTIKELGANGWIIATVFNQKLETRSALGYKVSSDFGSGYNFQDELQFMVLTPPLDEAMVKTWDTEFETKVKQRRYTQPTHYQGQGSLIEGAQSFAKAREEAEARSKEAVIHPSVLDENGIPYTRYSQVDDDTLDRINQDFTKTWRPNDYDDDFSYGLWGYGLDSEARALGVGKREYESMLRGADHYAIEKIEEKLEIAELQGRLK
jgi:hypothetical protein